MSNHPDESLLVRWARRKREANQGLAHEPAAEKSSPVAGAAETPDGAAFETASLPPESEVAKADERAEPEVRVEDLPDTETLTYQSDFSVFMRKGVPELIKQQALRKLWVSDPILANLDGLNDYDPLSMTFLVEDMEGAVEPIAEVGRGLRDKIMEAKQARDNRPRGSRRPRSGQDGERNRRLEAEQTADAGSDNRLADNRLADNRLADNRAADDDERNSAPADKQFDT